MRGSTQRRCSVFRTAVLVSGIVAVPVPAAGSADTVFALRKDNPFLQVFGLPSFQPGTLASTAKPDYVIGLDLANNADFGATYGENFLIDNESDFLTLSFRRRMNDWPEFGADLPFVAHGGGFMDSGIRKWQEIFGMSNTRRRGADEQLRFLYERDGVTLYEQSTSASGTTVQLDVGLTYRQKRSGSCLRFAVIEDIQADATTDFGLHFSFASRCGAPRPTLVSAH